MVTALKNSFRSVRFNFEYWWLFNTYFIRDVFFFSLFFASIAFVKIVVANVNMVPSASMYPTLVENDFLLVNKLMDVSDIDRGDIITFEGDKYMVKRVIGLPGDKVEIKSGRIVLNGLALDQRGISVPHMDSGQVWLTNHVPFNSFEESIPQLDGSLKHYQVTYAQRLKEDFLATIKMEQPVIVVPQGKYFVMGDNRIFSKDSRYFGVIDADDIVGSGQSLVFNWKEPVTFISNLFTGSDKPTHFRYLSALQ